MELTRRQRIEELMDQPGLDQVEHRRALRGLARLNSVGFAASPLWRPVWRLARQVHPRPLTMLDVATGAGDVPLRLVRRASRRGLSIKLTGVDSSPVALAAARGLADKWNLPADFQLLDVLNDPLPGESDVVTCSLFLHHLDDSSAEGLLRKLMAAARRAVLISDLQRSWTNLRLVQAASRVVTRSKIVHTDADRSVRSAFNLPELRRLADRAGMDHARIDSQFPCRVLLHWQRSSGNQDDGIDPDDAA